MPALDIFLPFFRLQFPRKPRIRHPELRGCICAVIFPAPVTYHARMRFLLPFTVFFQFLIFFRLSESPDDLPVLIIRICTHRLIQCFRTAGIFFSHIGLENYFSGIDLFLFHISLLILQFLPPVIHTKTPCFHPWSLTADPGHPFPGTHMTRFSHLSLCFLINSSTLHGVCVPLP